MAQSHVEMEDWTIRSLTGCAGIISSCLLLGKRIFISSGLPDVLAALGPLLMSSDIGTRKCLLTKQCFHPGLGVLVLVSTLLPFSGSGALDNGSRESEETVDSEDLEKEVAVVVAVVRIDSTLLNCWYSISGVQVHPGSSFRWKDLVVSSKGLRWDHSRRGGHLHRAFLCQK